MSEEIKFLFKLDTEVRTPFSEDGIIVMLGYDEGGCKYYVQTAHTSAWFKEKQLIVID